MRRVLFWLVAATLLITAALVAAFYVAIAIDADNIRPRMQEMPPRWAKPKLNGAQLALNGQVTQETINDTICKRGWAREVRTKSVSWLQKKKRELLLQREG